MMRRVTVFLAACVLFFLALFCVFGGLDEGNLPAAILRPGVGVPFVFLETGGSFHGALLSSEFFCEVSRSFPLLGGLRSFFPFLEKAEATAALFSMERGRLLFDAVLRYDRNVSDGLAKGKLPANADSSLTAGAVSCDIPDLYVLQGPPPFFPLYFRGKGELTLVGSSPEKIAAMVETLEKKTGGMTVDWNVEKTWPNHFLFYDGGIISHVAAGEKQLSAEGDISVEAAWKKGENTGRLKWETEGLEDFFASVGLEGTSPVKWDEAYLAPEPFLFSFGVNPPPGAADLLGQESSGIWNLRKTAGLGEKELEKLADGPIMGSLCGTGKFLVFSLPGLLFQLPGRGAAGKDFARSFWSREWSSLVPSVEKIAGFTEGGTTAIPFSILCAANSEMLRIGIIDREYLKPEKEKEIGDFIPRLREGKKAVFWAFLNGPAFGEAIRSLGHTGKIAEKMGRSPGIDIKTALRAADYLEKTGILSVIMPSLKEGIIEWERSPYPVRTNDGTLP